MVVQTRSSGPGSLPVVQPCELLKGKRWEEGAWGTAHPEQPPQLPLAQGRLVALPARILVESGHDGAIGLIQGGCHV